MENEYRPGDDRLSFRDYQIAAAMTDQVCSSQVDKMKSLMVPLLGLAGESGSLLTEFKKWLRQGEIYSPFHDQVSEELGDILWYVANIASKMNLDLDEIARENLAKLADRWGKGGASRDDSSETEVHRYDAEFPEDEQLPTEVEAEFKMVMDKGRRKLALTIDGKPFGNKLTDNSHGADGYRFHDVIHLTFALLLGWSPIIRRQLNVKRRSQPDIDEVEDGGRAAVTEEAIAVTVYSFAKDYSFFKGAESVEYDLLRTIKMMTRPFEVHDRTPLEWQTAILQAFGVWRELIANDGGVVFGDANNRTVSYRPLPKE